MSDAASKESIVARDRAGIDRRWCIRTPNAAAGAAAGECRVAADGGLRNTKAATSGVNSTAGAAGRVGADLAAADRQFTRGTDFCNTTPKESRIGADRTVQNCQILGGANCAPLLLPLGSPPVSVRPLIDTVGRVAEPSSTLKIRAIARSGSASESSDREEFGARSVDR